MNNGAQCTTSDHPSQQQNSYNKHVKLLFSSQNPIHKKNNRTFRDVLQGMVYGSFDVQNFNLAGGREFDAIKWLSDDNNRILLSVDEEGARLLSQCIHDIPVPELAKVLSVSFGKTKPQDMVPRLKEHTGDQKDFCLELDDSKSLHYYDFEECKTMQSLVIALRASFS